MDARKTALRLTLIGIVAFILRMLFIATLDNSVDVWGDWWDELGWRLAQGQGFWVANPYFPDAGRFYSWRAPGFPFFLSLVYRLAGHHFLAAKIALAAVSSLTAVILFGVGSLIAGPAVGWWSAILYAVYPPAIFWTGYLVPETLAAFLLVSLVLLCLAGMHYRTPLWFAAAGIALGAGILTRSAFAVFVPVIGIWLLPSLTSADVGLSHRFRLQAFAALLGGTVVVALPWVVRNYAVHGRLVLTSTEGGVVCYIANNERSLSEPSGYWNPPAEEFEYLRHVSEVDADRCLYRKAFQYIRSRPGEFVRRVADRFLRYWRPMPHSFSGPGGPYRSLYIWGCLAVMIPLFLLCAHGFWLSLRRWKDFSLLYLVVAAWSLPTILLFKVVIRYREPVMPFFLVFAALSLSHLVRRRGAGGCRS